MIIWGGEATVNKGPTCSDRGPKCAGTVPPPQDFHFNHCRPLTEDRTRDLVYTFIRTYVCWRTFKLSTMLKHLLNGRPNIGLHC